MKLLKRDEVLSDINKSGVISSENPDFTFEVDVKTFEAGTPFYIDLNACGEAGNDVSGLVFIRKK